MLSKEGSLRLALTGLAGMAGACGISLTCANKIGDAHDTDLDRPVVEAGSVLST